MARALERLGEAGSDVGPRWRAVKMFLYRLSAFCTDSVLCNYMVELQLTHRQGQKRPVLSEDEVCQLAGYVRGFHPDPRTIYSDRVVLDAILWPLAIEELRADIDVARALVTDVLPRIMSRMVMPDLGFTRTDTDLFLEDVDVSELVAELAYLPVYEKLNAPGTPLAAPLSSPDGAFRVPEAETLEWQAPSWRLGAQRPVRCWARVVEEARTEGKDVRSAEAMLMMCRAAAEKEQRAERAERARSAERAEADMLSDNPRIRLEMLKVPSLYAVVRRRLDNDPGSKVVVMFNFLEPMRAFAQLIGQRGGEPVLQVSGNMQPKRRIEAVERFNDCPRHRIMLCTIQVMNEGIDLHDTRGGEHRYAFIMACPNAIMTQQAKGRVHRAGIRSHAVTCVVYGGYALGGEAEEQLVMRIGTKNATMQTVAPTLRLTSTAAFEDLCAGIHAGDAAALASSRASLASRPAAAPLLRPHLQLPTSTTRRAMNIDPRVWRTSELISRSWPIVARLRDLAARQGDGSSATSNDTLRKAIRDSLVSRKSEGQSHTQNYASDLQDACLAPPATDDTALTPKPRTTIWEFAVPLGAIDAAGRDKLASLTFERAMKTAELLHLASVRF